MADTKKYMVAPSIASVELPKTKTAKSVIGHGGETIEATEEQAKTALKNGDLIEIVATPAKPGTVKPK